MKQVAMVVGQAENQINQAHESKQRPALSRIVPFVSELLHRVCPELAVVVHFL